MKHVCVLLVVVMTLLSAGCANQREDSGSKQAYDCGFLWSHTNQSIPLIPVVAFGQEGFIFPRERSAGELSLADAEDYWTPTLQDVERIEPRMRAFLQSARGLPSTSYPEEIDKVLAHFSEFRRQYVGIVVNGAKRILVNSFPRRDVLGCDVADRTFVIAADGGFWFWRVVYDIETGQFLSFDANGDA
jgi:hypothetical protein